MIRGVAALHACRLACVIKIVAQFDAVHGSRCSLYNSTVSTKIWYVSTVSTEIQYVSTVSRSA